MQNAGQVGGGHVKQRRICEHAIEPAVRQVEFQKILQPYFTSSVSPSHLDEAFRTLEPDRDVAPRDERFQVAARSTPEIKDGEWRDGLDVTQQGVDVLTDVMIARAFAKANGGFVVMRERSRADCF